MVFVGVLVCFSYIYLNVEGGMQLSCTPFVTTRTHYDYFVVFWDREKRQEPRT